MMTMTRNHDNDHDREPDNDHNEEPDDPQHEDCEVSISVSPPPLSARAPFHFILYPCCTKTREVLGNPSPTPKRFPETREISRGRSPREISRVEGNLEG